MSAVACLFSVSAGRCCICSRLGSGSGPGHPLQSSRRRLIPLLPHLADFRQHAPTGIRTPRHCQDDPTLFFLPVGAGRCCTCSSVASGSRPRPGHPLQPSRRRLIPLCPPSRFSTARPGRRRPNTSTRQYDPSTSRGPKRRLYRQAKDHPLPRGRLRHRCSLRDCLFVDPICRQTPSSWLCRLYSCPGPGRRPRFSCARVQDQGRGPRVGVEWGRLYVIVVCCFDSSCLRWSLLYLSHPVLLPVPVPVPLYVCAIRCCTCIPVLLPVAVPVLIILFSHPEGD